MEKLEALRGYLIIRVEKLSPTTLLHQELSLVLDRIEQAIEQLNKKEL